MDVIWNQNRMMTLLQNFYTLIKVRVGFFDLDGKEIMCYPASRTNYCTLLRSDKKGDAACRKCDQNAFRQAAKYQTPYIYRCHAGLTEIIAPIQTSADEWVGYLMIGQAKPPENRERKEWEEIYRKISGTGISPEELTAAYSELTVLKMDQARSCANILQSLAAYVWLDNYFRIQKEPLSSRVKTYISDNLNKNLSLDRIARKFSVGKTTLCKVVKGDLNVTVNELIRSLRIERAKELLESNEELISKIAEEVGITDYNYFTKVFKEETSVTPSVFRRLCEEEYLYRQLANQPPF
jgi:ligand-binding sensor protein